MRQIVINFIPKGQPHRHGLPDSDDYYYGPDGELIVVITEQGDSRDTMLLTIHAINEAIINEYLEVTPEMVDKYDATIPDYEQPGDNPNCPYFLSHQAAIVSERAAGIVLKRVLWAPTKNVGSS